MILTASPKTNISKAGLKINNSNKGPTVLTTDHRSDNSNNRSQI